MNTTLLLSLIQMVVPLVTQGMEFITKTAASLKQSKELTPEQDAALDAEIDKLRSAPNPWQVEQPL